MSRKNFSRTQIADYWDAWEDFCHLCGQHDTRLQRCHIDALVDGGADELDNIRLMCPRCHRATEGMGRASFDKLVLVLTNIRSANARRTLLEKTLIALHHPAVCIKLDSELTEQAIGEILDELENR